MNKPTIKTTCPYCGVGCGVEAMVEDAASFKISVKGDSEHPADFGRLCFNGSALPAFTKRMSFSSISKASGAFEKLQ